ncbi:hypothetical protein QOZ80_5AG0366350 [Eleusine coracana subsp. coracana]|nr:hypothetical protein QOZ80_5AG0366350 [Eleusine coracana subsp. coracana]
MAESQGPHMNPPATVEPLLSEANVLFNPANVFASPYDSVSAYTGAKNLVLCEGSLYQVWRNTSCTVTFQLPGGGQHRVLENEIFVLKHNPQRQACWDVVKDLGGYSFFVGRNNAVSMYGEGVPGLKGNCVYWIGGRGRDQGMVFDMATGRSASCQVRRGFSTILHLPDTWGQGAWVGDLFGTGQYGRGTGSQAPGVGLALEDGQMAICWYFLNDIVSSRSSRGRRVDQTPVGVPSVLIQDLQE